MQYLVKVEALVKVNWQDMNGVNTKWQTEYYEFVYRKDAVEFADRKEKNLREKGCEFSISIYERTNC